MTTGKSVVVKQFPQSFDQKQQEAFLRDLEPHLESDRPYLVFDFSGVQFVSSAGVELLMLCMEESMKRNGDLKLASVSPELAAILEMTRVDRLFEIFENCGDAVQSFHRFSPSALQPAFSDRPKSLARNRGISSDGVNAD
jgi:anti-sigma B factor antagonist